MVSFAGSFRGSISAVPTPILRKTKRLQRFLFSYSKLFILAHENPCIIPDQMWAIFQKHLHHFEKQSASLQNLNFAHGNWTLRLSIKMWQEVTIHRADTDAKITIFAKNPENTAEIPHKFSRKSVLNGRPSKCSNWQYAHVVSPTLHVRVDIQLGEIHHRVPGNNSQHLSSDASAQMLQKTVQHVGTIWYSLLFNIRNSNVNYTESTRAV